MMETGNPKQVAILGVMAVGAIGFLFSRMGGKPLPVVARASAGATSAARSVSVAPALPLIVDPFSHPKLAAEKSRETEAEPAKETIVGKPFVGGPLPLVGDFTAASAGPLAPPKVAPITVAPSKPVVPVGTMVALEGTAGATDAVAFLSVGGAESLPFRPNDLVKGKVRLLRVEDGAVVLSGPKGELTLSVGERKRI